MSNTLAKLESQALAEFTNEPVIANHLGGSLKKFAGLLAVSLSLLSVTNSALADNNKAYKLSAVLGSVAGVAYLGGNNDAAKVMGAAAAGGLAGSQIGNGNGRIAATLIGAGLAGSYVANSVVKQRQQESLRINGNPNGYNNNGNYNNNNNYNPNIIRQPSAFILYQVNGPTGFFVTMDNSLAVKQFKGEKTGERNLADEPSANQALNATYHNLVASHQKLEAAAVDYEQLALGQKAEDGRIKRQMYYSTDVQGQVAVNPTPVNMHALNASKSRLDAAELEYSQARAAFLVNADNAAFENFNVSGYAQAMNYLKPTEKVLVNVIGNNRYGIVRQERMAFNLR